MVGVELGKQVETNRKLILRSASDGLEERLEAELRVNSDGA
jgi:hypothetical protein